jgi:hypothetical protein
VLTIEGESDEEPSAREMIDNFGDGVGLDDVIPPHTMHVEWSSTSDRFDDEGAIVDEVDERGWYERPVFSHLVKSVRRGRGRSAARRPGGRR